MPLIFHFKYDDMSGLDIAPYKYLSIISAINVNKPLKVYFHYNILPNGYLWNKIEDRLVKFKISYLDSYEYTENDIWLELNTLCINPINKLTSHKIYIDNNDIFKEIYDYSFGKYFNLVKNNNIIYLSKNDAENIDQRDILTKITIYNLLVRNALAYQYINNICLLYPPDKLKLINNIDKILWINLDKSPHRKDNMIKILNNFNIDNQRVSAIDGSIEDNVALKYFDAIDNIYPMYSNKEYAVLLSHLNTIDIYSKMDELKYGVGLICEDDLSLDFINYWEDDISTIINNAPDDWDIIMLGYISINLELFGKNTYKKWNNEWSAISYLVNHKSIQKIDNLKKDGKWICRATDLMVSDNYIFSKFNTYVYKYPYFTFPNDNDSTVHIDHLDYHRLYKITNYMTLEKIDKYI